MTERVALCVMLKIGEEGGGGAGQADGTAVAAHPSCFTHCFPPQNKVIDSAKSFLLIFLS